MNTEVALNEWETFLRSFGRLGRLALRSRMRGLGGGLCLGVEALTQTRLVLCNLKICGKCASLLSPNYNYTCSFQEAVPRSLRAEVSSSKSCAVSIHTL